MQDHEKKEDFLFFFEVSDCKVANPCEFTHEIEKAL